MSLKQKIHRYPTNILASPIAVLVRSLLLICLGFVGASSTQPLVNQPIDPLTMDVVDREIAAGESQLFEVSLAGNQLLRFSLEKGDLAIRLIITDASGQKLIEQVSRRYEVMAASVVANSAGTYHIEV